MNDFIYGATSYLTGFRLIARYKLWVYFWIPILLSVILGYSIYEIAYGLSDNIGGWLVSFYPFEWGKESLERVANTVGGIGLIAFSLLIFRYIIMAISAPFMSLLSERMEQKMYPDRPKTSFSLTKMMSDLVRGVRIALRNVFKEIFLTLVLLLFGIIIPVISPLVPILILLLQAYYAGFANFDYTLERRMNVRQSVRYIRQNRMLVMGNGIVFVLSLLTVIGFLFIIPLGTAAGCVVVLEDDY